MSSIPKIPRKPQRTLSYNELQAENKRLKAELADAKQATGGVKLSTQDNRLEVNNLETPDISVDRLTVESTAVDKVGELLSSASLVKSKGKLPTETLKDVAKEPVRVEAMKVRVPDDTVNRIVKGNPTKNLKGFEVEFGDDGAFQVRGKVNKIADVPFELAGFIDTTDDGQVRLKIGNSKIFGMVPVPKLIQNMATAMAGKKLEKLGITPTEDGLVMDPAALIPKNVDFKVSEVTTRDGELVVEGGPRTPKVLTMGPWGPRPTT